MINLNFLPSEKLRPPESQRGPHQTIVRDLNSPRTYYGRACALVKLGDSNGAISLFQKIIQLNPKDDENTNKFNSKVYNSWGKVLISQKKYSEATQKFDKAITLYSNLYEAYYICGLTFIQLGKYNEAIDHFSWATEIKPNRLDENTKEFYSHIYKSWGNVLRSQKNYSEAILKFGEAINLYPNYEAYYLRGLSFIQLGKHDDATKDFTRAVEIKSNQWIQNSKDRYGRVYNNWGDMLRSQKHFEAILKFDKAIALDPNSYGSYCLRGLAFTQLGNHNNAVKDFARTVEIKPNQPIKNIKDRYSSVYESWGNMLRSKGKYSEAVLKFDEAIALCHNSQSAVEIKRNVSQTYLLWSTTLFAKNDPNAALTKIEKAIEVDPYDSKAYSSSALLLNHWKRHTEALAMINKAIEIKSSRIYFKYKNRILFDQKHTIWDSESAIENKCELSDALSGIDWLMDGRDDEDLLSEPDNHTEYVNITYGLNIHEGGATNNLKPDLHQEKSEEARFKENGLDHDTPVIKSIVNSGMNTYGGCDNSGLPDTDNIKLDLYQEKSEEVRLKENGLDHDTHVSKGIGVYITASPGPINNISHSFSNIQQGKKLNVILEEGSEFKP